MGLAEGRAGRVGDSLLPANVLCTLVLEDVALGSINGWPWREKGPASKSWVLLLFRPPISRDFIPLAQLPILLQTLFAPCQDPLRLL